MSKSPVATLGVIAGAGKFPIMVIEGAHRAGHRVVVLGLKEIADPALAELADEFHWVAPLHLGQWMRTLNRSGARSAVMAGYVRKQTMYRRFGILSFLPDWRFLKLWFLDIPDRRNDTVLKAVAVLLARHGIVLEDVTRHCGSAVAGEGTLGTATLTAAQRRDLALGWSIAKEMGRLDIGQSIAVKDAEVIAVEAIEGTDQMIERAGALCRSGGWMMVKVAKPDQDMRFDVPTVGPDTIANLQRHGASALVIEADKTVIVDREETIAAANRLGIAVVGALHCDAAGSVRSARC
ncbi:LpxI family protein [Methylococcus sp. EFPC2]|uniref:LpxI family protein n=1 Tax=Methylococcus sp. EFPC2 TaxID=2812648 RepID=UPI0019670681|nr:UDP-2,3-diacylglucosamine diphosphatase LpxI [Methylococcus sp. EFPC2]QSA96628.1 UDP-2,3-diacylglucosamine diphosphatase LpxI [Methylococcus sp. EFPC2]